MPSVLVERRGPSAVGKELVDKSDSVTAKVIQAIAKAKHISPDSITLESRLEDLRMDSLDGLDVFFELEEVFDMNIPDERVRSVRSVQEIVDEITKLLEQKTAPNGENRAQA